MKLKEELLTWKSCIVTLNKSTLNIRYVFGILFLLLKFLKENGITCVQIWGTVLKTGDKCVTCYATEQQNELNNDVVLCTSQGLF